MQDSALPLQAAVDNADVNTVRQLLTEDADAATTGGASTTSPIFSALWRTKNEEATAQILQMFFENGADPNRSDHVGDFPVHIAAERGYLKVLKVLRATGKCDLEARDYCNQTPLMRASISHRPQFVQALVDAGVDVNAVNDLTGSTALHNAVYCKTCGDVAGTIKALKKAGAKQDLPNKQNFTPVELADVHSSEVAFELLGGEDAKRNKESDNDNNNNSSDEDEDEDEDLNSENYSDYSDGSDEDEDNEGYSDSSDYGGYSDEEEEPPAAKKKKASPAKKKASPVKKKTAKKAAPKKKAGKKTAGKKAAGGKKAKAKKTTTKAKPKAKAKKAAAGGKKATKAKVKKAKATTKKAAKKPKPAAKAAGKKKAAAKKSKK